MIDAKLHPSEKVKDAIKAGKNIFLTGPAGTGKSYLIRELADSLPISVAVSATTGVAAMNLSAVTVHSFLGLGIQTSVEFVDTLKHSQRWRIIKNQINHSDLIIIDEISMMRASVLELADAILKEATGHDAVFGGKQLILSGDFLQLPPVVKSHEKILAPWAFQSRLWSEADFSVFCLTEIFRQEDREFIAALNELRHGRCPPWVNDMMKGRVKAKLKTELKPIRFLPMNAQVNEFNTKCLQALTGPPKIYEAGAWGLTESLKQQIIRDCPAPMQLVLKEGAQVMVLKNDTGCESYVNGSMGMVVGFTETLPIIKIAKTGEEIIFKKHAWDLQDVRGTVLASFEQLPLKLAYATTIHKSQGLTLDYAEVNCSRIFSEGQAYVALSRVRTLDGLRLLNWDKNLVAANKEALQFYNNGCRW
jgi:ATP-dependent exoDNAse (exonuclease V) alpha subunit